MAVVLGYEYPPNVQVAICQPVTPVLIHVELVRTFASLPSKPGESPRVPKSFASLHFICGEWTAVRLGLALEWQCEDLMDIRDQEAVQMAENSRPPDSKIIQAREMPR
jgi:hypothetical protein